MVLEIDVLEIINEKRNHHGIRNSDYQRYRRFCTKKLSTLRKRAELSGSGKLEITKDNITSEQHILVLIFQIERAWSYAMELQIEITDETNRKKHHLMKKLKRANKYANQLLDCLTGPIHSELHDSTLLNLQAYCFMMNGFLLFEEKKWESSLEKFGQSKAIYEKLASVSTSSHQTTLYYSWIDTIDPNIRYCAFNMKGTRKEEDVAALLEMKNIGSDLLNSKVENLLARERQKRTTSMQSIQFRSTALSVGKNIKLVNSLLNIDQKIADLDTFTAAIQKGSQSKDQNKANFEKNLALFDHVLGAMWDASGIAEADINEDILATSKVKSSKSESNTLNLKMIHGYVTYQRLTRTIQRNLVLVDYYTFLSQNKDISKKDTQVKDKLAAKDEGGEHSLEDVVKLYDVILQTLKEMKGLPVFESDSSMQFLITVQEGFYSAFRTYYLSAICSKSSKFPEFTALVERSKKYLGQARQLIISSKTKAASLQVEDIEQLKILEQGTAKLDNLIKKIDLQTRAEIFLDKGKVVEENPDFYMNPALSTNLQKFSTNFSAESPNLVDFPPNYIPIPAKPFFFDIANNYIDYPMENIVRRSKGLSRVAYKPTVSSTEVVEEKKKDEKGLLGYFFG